MEQNVKHYMPMSLIDKIKSIADASVPSYAFEFETSKMMNARADDRPYPMVFLEEYPSQDGRYLLKYGLKKAVTVELSFMRLADRENFQGDAIDRERIREQIEEEAVLPFIDAFNASGLFEPIEEFRVTPEPPRFDASAVSILLIFEARWKIC